MKIDAPIVAHTGVNGKKKSQTAELQANAMTEILRAVIAKPVRRLVVAAHSLRCLLDKIKQFYQELVLSRMIDAEKIAAVLTHLTMTESLWMLFAMMKGSSCKKWDGQRPPQQTYHIMGVESVSIFFLGKMFISAICIIFGNLFYGGFHLAKGQWPW